MAAGRDGKKKRNMGAGCVVALAIRIAYPRRGSAHLLFRTLKAYISALTYISTQTYFPCNA